LLPGKTSHGHYQIEMECSACHTTIGAVKQDACLDCHANDMKASNDTHPAKKFKNPSNAARLKEIDASYCITCHREHLPERTHEMGVTMPTDYCWHCHQETLKTRPSHANFAFDSCATAGCHNYHDNRALYENFLLKHGDDPAYLKNPHRPELTSMKTSDSALSISQANGAEKFHSEEILSQWSTTAHAASGVNCQGCHLTTTGGDETWTNAVTHQVCQSCHKNQTKGFLEGKHGMRIAAGLSPMTPAQARLPMHVDAAHRELSCTSCHDDHRFDTRYAATHACLKCHNDDHSNAFLTSSHATNAEASVTCATCHMPRVEGDDGSVFVNHNQNNNLRPNEKMIREVCMNCHGLAFSIDSLADPELVRNCYSTPPSMHIKSIDMAKAWFDTKETKRLERKRN